MIVFLSDQNFFQLSVFLRANAQSEPSIIFLFIDSSMERFFFALDRDLTLKINIVSSAAAMSSLTNSCQNLVTESTGLIGTATDAIFIASCFSM